MTSSHGQDVLVLERRELLKILYENLPDKSRVRLGTKVTNVVDGVDQVEVHLADGTTEQGDMVLGCDGVHSLIRESMWENANKSVPDLITVAEKKCRCQVLLPAAIPKPF
jgi:2-polyprenyl-6-methoxyphenol hydroxylase-like FAD-dependent oxidoreductase